MILHGQFTEGAPDLVSTGSPGDIQNFVVIFIFHKIPYIRALPYLVDKESIPGFGGLKSCLSACKPVKTDSITNPKGFQTLSKRL
jgi:hypothetical protein